VIAKTLVANVTFRIIGEENIQRLKGGLAELANSLMLTTQ
jgi:hypothetical protein